jgi:hypothetical protein
LILVALTAALALVGAGCKAITSDASSTVPASVALQQLNELTVANSASMRGYSRDRFPHWRRAGSNCDVRDVVLKRDGINVTVNGCNVVGGSWHSPYEDKWFDTPNAIDIDHMVPLANAWRSGAAEWTDDVRGDFANDLDTPQLLAVSLNTNRAKGDQDPSLWRPTNRSYWCKYAQSWIAVKHHWKLAVTTPEKAALRDMLETCPWQSSGPPISSPAPAG